MRKKLYLSGVWGVGSMWAVGHRALIAEGAVIGYRWIRQEVATSRGH
jgi:hypothetical protein